MFFRSFSIPAGMWAIVDSVICLRKKKVKWRNIYQLLSLNIEKQTARVTDGKRELGCSIVPRKSNRIQGRIR